MQAYFASIDAVPSYVPATALLKELFDFERFTLAPGQITQHAFTLSATTFITFDAEGNQVLYPGAYSVIITNGVTLTLAANVVLVGDTRVVDTFI